MSKNLGMFFLGVAVTIPSLLFVQCTWESLKIYPPMHILHRGDISYIRYNGELRGDIYFPTEPCEIILKPWQSKDIILPEQIIVDLIIEENDAPLIRHENITFTLSDSGAYRDPVYAHSFHNGFHGRSGKITVLDKNGSLKKINERFYISTMTSFHPWTRKSYGFGTAIVQPPYFENK